MDVSLCIVTYNRPNDIRRLLHSLESQEQLPEELVIVDDSDNRQTEDIVSRFESNDDIELIYLHRETASGMTEARNITIEHASGEIIAFVDDDVVFPADWVKNLKEAWNSNSDAWAIGGPALVVNGDGEVVPDIIRTDENQNWLNKYGENRSEAGSWVPSKAVETDHLRGANMSFREDILDELDGFNPIYEGSEVYEETDIMARIQRRGGQVIYDPQLQVKHYKTSKAGASGDKELYYYWGYNKILFRYTCYNDVFWLSIARLLTINRERNVFPIVWFGVSVIKNTAWLWELKGYFDAIIYVLRNGNLLPVDRFDK